MNKLALDETTAFSLLLKACKNPSDLSIDRPEIVETFRQFEVPVRTRVLRQLWYDKQILAKWGEGTLPDRIVLCRDAVKAHLEKLIGDREAQEFLGDVRACARQSWQNQLKAKLITTPSLELVTILKNVSLPDEWKKDVNLLQILFAVYEDEFRVRIEIQENATEVDACTVRLIDDLNQSGRAKVTGI
jgi:hypothetical protein